MSEISQSIPTDLVAEAKKYYQAGKYQGAAEMFLKAAVLYEEAEEISLASEMRNNQAVALLQDGAPQLALEAVQGTSEIFKQAGDKLKMGMALANEATAYRDLGSTDQAMERFSQAAMIFKDLGEDELLMQTSQTLSSLKMKSRNIPGALISMQEGLQGVKKPNLRQRLLLNLLKVPNKLLGQ
jgi:tetratricopeptide (TPR) repeat protein